MPITKKEKPKKIPAKNYIYLALILLLSILIILYTYKWYETYKESKLNIGIMNNYLTVINYNELNDYIVENKDAIIYVSILGDEQINKFEESFKNIIIDNNLKNIILYLDITNENITTVKNNLEINTDLPCIVVYTSGEITDVYSIVDNDYSTQKILKYLNRIGAIESD